MLGSGDDILLDDERIVLHHLLYFLCLGLFGLAFSLGFGVECANIDFIGLCLDQFLTSKLTQEDIVHLFRKLGIRIFFDLQILLLE